jgi:hypothetical protein
MEFVKRIVIPRSHATYSSFPTFMEHGGRLFVFYRRGEKSVGKCHGLFGKVRCLEVETRVFLRAFQDEPEADIARSGDDRVVFDEGNEFDAIVSRLGDNLFSLATRNYDEHNVMHTFLSVSDSPRFDTRHEITVPGVRWLAFYGKALACEAGFIFPAYGCLDAERTERPLLLRTDDFRHFDLLAALPTNIDEAVLNESSLVSTEDGFAMFMRDDTFPFGIWYSFSKDLVVWEEPARLCFFAHAPMAITFRDTLYLAYRDLLSPNETGITLLDPAAAESTLVESYRGNPYDGGYTDMAVIDGRLFIVYYVGNEEGEPCIAACRWEKEEVP